MEREQRKDPSGAGGRAAELPKFLDLGVFAAECENTFAIAAPLAEGARVRAEIADAAVRAAGGGLLLTLPALRDGTLVYGALAIEEEREERCLFVSGEARAAAPTRQASHVQAPLAELLRGERLTLTGAEKLGFFYEDAGHEAGVDIDAYVFRLYEGNRAKGDADLIFFGNTVADDGSIRVEKDGAKIGASVDVAGLAAAVERVVICFSVYDDGAGRDFSHVRAPSVTLCEDGAAKYSFALDALRREKTVNAAEIYRHKGAWKMRLVGAGYEAGLARLCEDYGLSVE